MTDTRSSSAPHPLAYLGWDDDWSSLCPDLEHGVEPGRVVRVDRGLWSVLSERGLQRVGLSGDLLDATSDDPTAAPCVGDWALSRMWCDGRVTLERVLPRRTVVERGEAGGASVGQALAANLDVAVVVTGLDQDPSISRVERLLTLAWESGATPAVVLSKADLASDADDVAEDVSRAAPNVHVLVCSTVDGRGIEQLRELVGDGTAALLGSSGSGKSTLVNSLAGAEVLLTQAIRRDGRGRHTSVRRELVLLPGGGCVIDTPGLRSAGLSADGGGIAATFSDIEELETQCRFNDCSHESEPGCAIRAALDSGDLTPRRYESWRKLQREAAHFARRHDVRLRAAALAEAKQRAREGRKRRRPRP